VLLIRGDHAYPKSVLDQFCGVLGMSVSGLGAPELENQRVAQQLVDAFAQGDYRAATVNFNAQMRSALPVDELKTVWESLIGQVGSFKQKQTARTESTQGSEVIFIPCQFERAILEAKIVLNAQHQVAGLFFVPPKSASDYTPPPYARTENFQEKAVVVGSGELALHATLSIPKGQGSFPAVVLVHGSGSHDRDETIGPNKPFQDLAWGLASQGIAVLRYEKRTQAHPAWFRAHPEFTLVDETIDDAVLAVHLLETFPEVDAKRIFVLGHSLGGTAAPRIAQHANEIAGLILLAGASRPLEDLVFDQSVYAGLSAEQLAVVKTKVAEIKALKSGSKRPAQDLLLGLPASYWLDLQNYFPARVAASLRQPIFILQGGRDFQVGDPDFQLWQQTLKNRQNVQFASYPSLNHLFMVGTGKSTLAEYQQPGHIDEKVIADLSAWIKPH
jgi:uncharacterized protein